MLKNIVIENVKGKSGNYEFGKTTKLLGRNEVGKSGIKDAICYAFAGADAAGTRSPTHLISNDADALRVEVTSEKATISRTLTRKGSQSLSIVRGGVRTPCNQEQLSRALGASPALFLSSFVPGHFMSQSDHIRQAVLNEILPPVDRTSLLSNILGFSLTQDDTIMMGDMTRRPDLIAGSVSLTRRGMLGEYNQIKGQVESYTAMSVVNPTPPAKSDAADAITKLENLNQLWNGYATRHASWMQAKAAGEAARAWNASLATERASAEAEIAGVVFVEVPKEIDNYTRIEELQASILAEPAAPAVLALPEGDRCSCCGQVVGSKHREKVRADTDALRVQYNQARAEVVTANDMTTAKIEVLVEDMRASRRAKSEAERTNKAREEQLNKVRLRLARLVDRAIPELGPEPEQPGEKYDAAAYRKAKDELATQQRGVGQYEHALKQKEEAGHKLNELKAKLAPLATAIERFERIEAALAELPKRELALRSEQLTINGYTFSLEGTTVTRADGIAYSSLSTGAGLKADIMLCFKFNQLMGARAPGIIFIDNADLIDVVPPGDTPMQVFLAYVVPEIDKLTVEIG